MKRFLLFAGDFYYPGGGMNDFQGGFDTLDGILNAARQHKGSVWDWVHILDQQDGMRATIREDGAIEWAEESNIKK